jgi:superfamily II DNA or RNA helicase
MLWKNLKIILEGNFFTDSLHSDRRREDGYCITNYSRCCPKRKIYTLLAHRRELITQCAAKLEDFGVFNYSIIMSGAKMFNPDAKVNVASIQTLIKREFPPADLIIIDEAHRAASKSYRDILVNYPSAKVLGLSATPERLDGKGLDDIFNEIVIVTTVPELINQGHLVKPIIYTGGTFDLTGVKKSKGDYAEDQLQGSHGQA